VANPGYWPIKGEITLSDRATVGDPATGNAVATRDEGGKTIVPVELTGFGLAAFRTGRQTTDDRRRKAEGSGLRVRVESWRTKPVSDADLAHVRGIIDRADRLMAIPEIARNIALDERKLVTQTIDVARADIGEGRVAKAWHAVTNWKFWVLVHENLSKAANFAAAVPGYEAVHRDVKELPHLTVARAETGPEIDGKLDDAAWQEAPQTQGFLSLGTHGEMYGMPLVDTVVQVVYDGAGLYLAFTMADADMAALRAEAKTPKDMFYLYDDAVVFLLNPGGNNVLQMAVNPGGMKYNGNATGQTWMFREHHEDFGPWQAAVGKTETVWTVEVALPYSTLKTPPAQSGDEWGANIIRRFRKFAVPEMYWAGIDRTWYDLHRYGRLKFE